MDKTILKRTYSFIKTMTSSGGFSNGAFSIQCYSGTELKIELIGDTVKIGFDGELPLIKFQKIISISKNVTALYLTDVGGTLELKNFPDLPFEYEG